MLAAPLLAGLLCADAARAIAVRSHGRPVWAVLELPQDVDPGESGRYAGLRIRDDRGLQTPYVLDPGGLQAARTLRALAARNAGGFGARRGASIVTLDLGTPHTGVALLRFRTSQREFSRGVAVEASDDGAVWRYAGAGRIERFARGTPGLDVFVGTSARFVRATVANGDDAPLANLAVTAYGAPRYVAFVAAPGRSYALAEHREEAAPEYDLGAVLAADRPRAFARARMSGARACVPFEGGARAARPLLLTIACAFAILVFGGITLATIRSGRRGE